MVSSVNPSTLQGIRVLTCIGSIVLCSNHNFYRTEKKNFRNCLGIIGTDLYRACEVSGIIRTCKHAAARKLAKLMCD